MWLVRSGGWLGGDICPHFLSLALVYVHLANLFLVQRFPKRSHLLRFRLHVPRAVAIFTDITGLTAEVRGRTSNKKYKHRVGVIEF